MKTLGSYPILFLILSERVLVACNVRRVPALFYPPCAYITHLHFFLVNFIDNLYTHLFLYENILCIYNQTRTKDFLFSVGGIIRRPLFQCSRFSCVRQPINNRSLRISNFKKYHTHTVPRGRIAGHFSLFEAKMSMYVHIYSRRHTLPQ